ncbi:hypothetical protein ACSBR2_005975 [Camellia fascicularis]
MVMVHNNSSPAPGNQDLIGLLRIRVRRGINLAVRDIFTSDPYVVITMGGQTVKTRVVPNNCNPEWNEELTLSIKNPVVPIILSVYDEDTFTRDDKMGDAEIDIQPYVECIKVGKTVKPNMKNCLAKESSIVCNKGKIYQDMRLRLRNVERGEVEVQLEWIDRLGRKVSQG